MPNHPPATDIATTNRGGAWSRGLEFVRCRIERLGMVKISVNYQGDLHCAAVHGPSGASLETDAPVDNQGRGESFSPTDLVATALATCIATTMGIAAQREEISLEGLAVSTAKEMSADAPRRIVRLATTLTMPRGFPEEHRAKYENIARTCPVARSVSAEIDAPIEFIYP